MKYPRYNLDSPEVKAILAGIHRSGSQSYYRICPETGKHFIQPVRKELMDLGMCGKTASGIMQAADLPRGQFIHNRSELKSVPIPERPIETEVEATVKVRQPVKVPVKQVPVSPIKKELKPKIIDLDNEESEPANEPKIRPIKL